MTTAYTAQDYHDRHVAEVRAAIRDAVVSCPHCPTLVVPSRMAEHMAFHHPDIALSPDERELLRAYEADIEDGLSGLERMARALFNVRERKLYREQYKTFAAYCKERWGKSRQWGNNFAVAAGVIDFLSTFVDAEHLPQHESHIRPLTALPDEALVPVWAVIRDTAPDGKITGGHIKSVVTFAEQMITTGAVDDGTGKSIRVADIAHAAITEETYERWARQRSHIEANSKRRRILSAEAAISKIDKQDDGVYVTVRLPAGADVTEARATYIARKPVFLNLYTEKELS